jgi:hypothetical protein
MTQSKLRTRCTTANTVVLNFSACRPPARWCLRYSIGHQMMPAGSTLSLPVKNGHATCQHRYRHRMLSQHFISFKLTMPTARTNHIHSDCMCIAGKQKLIWTKTYGSKVLRTSGSTHPVVTTAKHLLHSCTAYTTFPHSPACVMYNLSATHWAQQSFKLQITSSANLS